MSKQLIFTYTLMILLPVLAVTLVGFQKYNQNLKAKVANFDIQLLGQIGKNLDNYLEELDRISLTIYMDDNLKEALKNKAYTPSTKYQEKLYIDKALRNLFLSPMKDIVGAYLFKADGSVYYTEYGTGNPIQYDDVAGEPWFKDVLAAAGQPMIVPSHLVRSSDSKSIYALSYARSLIDVENNEAMGILMMDVALDGIANVLSNVNREKGGQLFVTDANGQILYHPDSKRIANKFSYALSQTEDSFSANIDDVSMMINYVTSPSSGWKVVGLVPIHELTDDLNIIRNLLWTLAVVTLLISVSLSAILTSYMIRPLKKIRALMRRVEEGDYKVRYPSPSRSEVGQVGHSFNVMIQKINELVNNVMAANLLKKDADFKALQSQINPHFLFNTLESINMKAEMNRDYEVAEMVSSLGDLFRKSMNVSRERIPFSQEIDYIRVYIELQKIRFPKMEFSIELPNEVLLSYTLPWIIQPLVENAIVHGLAPYKGEGSILIKGALEGENVLIRVVDDGVGISLENLEKVRSHLESEASAETSHIGLKNVHDRIRLSFGYPYGLKVSGDPESGTCVEISIKYLGKE